MRKHTAAEKDTAFWKYRAEELEKDLDNVENKKIKLEKDLAKERKRGKMFYLGIAC